MPSSSPYSSKEWIKRFEEIARRDIHGERDFQNDVFGAALEKFSVKVQSFPEGHSEGYAVVVFRRLLTDELRAIRGRPRPEKWIRELGALWVMIWDYTCQRGWSCHELDAFFGRYIVLAEQDVDGDEKRKVEDVDGEVLGHVPPPDKKVGFSSGDARVDVARACREIRRRSSACNKRSFSSLDDPDHQFSDSESYVEWTPEDVVTDDETQDLAERLGECFFGEDDSASILAELAGSDAVELNLTDDERFMLAAKYQLLMTDAKTAEALGKAPHEVRRARDSLLEKLRERFEGLGLSLEDLVDDE